MRRLVPRLSYANVMSTLAVVLVVMGGATALAALTLPKNSVKSKNIAKEAVKTADLAKDAATGDKVKESTLAKVPAAVHADSADTASSANTATTAQSLAGIGAQELEKTKGVSSASFTGDLTLSVSGYGYFILTCRLNGSGTEDDTLALNYAVEPSLDGGIVTGIMTAQEFPPYTALQTSLLSGIISSSSSYEVGVENRVVDIHLSVNKPGSTKSIVVDGGGADIYESNGCSGSLRAYTTS